MTELRTSRVDVCPICESTSSARFFVAPDYVCSVPGLFSYDRCNACGTVYQNPQVIAEDLAQGYPEHYYTHTPGPRFPAVCRTGSVLKQWVRNAIVRHQRRQAQPTKAAIVGALLANSRRLRERAFYGLLDELAPRASESAPALEIGCGSGQLLHLLSQNGWLAEGIEWDPAAAAIAQARTGLPVAVGDFISAKLPTHNYDLIVLVHVFEHLPRPQCALRRLAQLLRPGGRAVLICPNPRAISAWLFGADWYPWEPPRHLVLAPARAVVEAGRRYGLRAHSWRSLERTVGLHVAWSRCRRLGLPWPPGQPGPFDFALTWFSRRLAPLGLSDEWLIAFERSDSAGPHLAASEAPPANGEEVTTILRRP